MIDCEADKPSMVGNQDLVIQGWLIGLASLGTLVKLAGHTSRPSRRHTTAWKGFLFTACAIESPLDFLLSKDKRYSGESEVPVTLPADVFNYPKTFR